MSEKTKEVKYLVCDGCGYGISPKVDPYLILTMMLPGEASVDIHFHAPEKIGELRSWGTKDCLHYWVTSRVAHGHSQGWRGGGLEDGACRYVRDVSKETPL